MLPTNLCKTFPLNRSKRLNGCSYQQLITGYLVISWLDFCMTSMECQSLSKPCGLSERAAGLCTVAPTSSIGSAESSDLATDHVVGISIYTSLSWSVLKLNFS